MSTKSIRYCPIVVIIIFALNVKNDPKRSIICSILKMTKSSGFMFFVPCTYVALIGLTLYLSNHLRTSLGLNEFVYLDQEIAVCHQQDNGYELVLFVL